MREIKFRAWDEDKRIMLEKTLYAWLEWASIYFHSETSNIENANWMQFTGLKDKNGKEIYESDLLQWEDSEDVLEVRWIDASWQMFGSYNKMASHKWEDSEIVGNLYEGLKND